MFSSRHALLKRRVTGELRMIFVSF